jgi:hypothetical protein
VVGERTLREKGKNNLQEDVVSGRNLRRKER